MQGWIEGIQRSVEFIEDNLDDELPIAEISRVSGLSSFYFQRIFGALCGMTVGEYIRARRMTLAAQELSAGSVNVIDVALKYGYDSPDSFTKAFQRFHGVTPTRAMDKGTVLRSMSPLQIKIKLEGKNMLDYRIVEKAPFTIVGMRRQFSADTSYQEIPKYWKEWKETNSAIQGMFGVCMDGDGRQLDYWIADVYVPWKDIPEGCETAVIPGGLWAEFLCKGPLPESLQNVNTQIWTEWLPNLKGYELAGSYNLEVYMPPAEDPSNTVSYICVPLKKL